MIKPLCKTYSLTWILPLFLSLSRETSITTPPIGATKMNTTLSPGELGLTHKRPSCRPFGTHLSPRSVLE